MPETSYSSSLTFTGKRTSLECPRIERSKNPDFCGKLEIIIESVITQSVSPFDNLQEVKAYLLERFGVEEYSNWFSKGIAQKSNCYPACLEDIFEVKTTC